MKLHARPVWITADGKVKFEMQQNEWYRSIIKLPLGISVDQANDLFNSGTLSKFYITRSKAYKDTNKIFQKFGDDLSPKMKILETVYQVEGLPEFSIKRINKTDNKKLWKIEYASFIPMNYETLSILTAHQANQFIHSMKEVEFTSLKEAYQTLVFSTGMLK